MTTGDVSAYPGFPTEVELNRTARAVEERNARIAHAVDRASRMEFSAEAGHGAVRATVDASGGLRRIELNARGSRLSAPEIVPLITACIQQAQSSIGERVGQVMAEEVGGQDSATQFVVDEYRNRFPVPENSGVDFGVDSEMGSEGDRWSRVRLASPAGEEPMPAPQRRKVRQAPGDEDDADENIMPDTWRAD